MNQQYEKFEVIGKGLRTIVYEGHDHGPLDRAIAIKELADSDDARRLKSFLGEARSLANLDHEHLVKVFDVDVNSNMVITELLEGSLDGLIQQQGPMSSDRVRSVVQQSLKALNYLHQKKIIFGAIRPSKLMFSYRGKVKLGSFEQLADGVVPRPEVEKYVAPEALDVSFGEVGPTLDFYCLGFTALELLLGDRFDAVFPVISEDPRMAKVDWLRWHGGRDEIPSTKKLVPGIADDLAEALDRMLRKQVSERPQSALEVFSLLKDINPIPIIDGVEQSIRFESRKRFATDERDPNSEASNDKTEKLPTPAPILAANHPAEHLAAKTEPLARHTRNDNPTQDSHKPSKKRSYLWILPLLLCFGGVAFGGWWVYENDPWDWFATPVIAADVPVEFQFSPADIGAVSVTKDGIAIAENSDGKWLLPAGEHQLEFSAGDFQASKNVQVDSDKSVFQVALSKTVKPEQPVKPMAGSFAKRFTVDPRNALLEILGEKLDLENGFGTRTFESSEAGKRISVVATAKGYQNYRQEIDLQPEAITHINMAPWLTVEPEDVVVQLAGKAIIKTAENRYPLPRLDSNYELKITKEGYLPFEGSDVTFDSLRSREFKIKLDPDFDRLYAIGIQALGDKDFDSAIKSLAVVLDHDDEKYVKGYLLRGTAHQSRAAGIKSLSSSDPDSQRAIEDFTSFIRKGQSTATDADKAKTYLRRARVYRSTDQFDNAISDLRSSNKLLPSDEVNNELAKLLSERAQRHVDSDDLPAAIADLEEARKLAPQMPAIDATLANICFRHGNQLMESRNPGTAKKQFDRAIELQSDNPEFFVARGKCKGSINLEQGGIDDYTTAIKMAPQPKNEWLLGRASLYQRLDDLNKAITDYNRATELVPGDPSAYLLRGQLYRRKLKNFPQAIKDFRMALENRYSPVFDVKLEIAQTLYDGGETEFSQAHFSEAISQFTASIGEFQSIEQTVKLSGEQSKIVDGKLTETYCRLADGFNASKDYREAVAKYSIAIKRGGPKDKVALARRANCYKALNQFEKAETDLRAALEIDGDYASAKFYWGQLKIKSGDAKARSRFNAPAGKKQDLKVQAIKDYRSAIEMLEGLVATKKEVRYYDLIITACSRMNVVDTNETNASLLKKWQGLKQEKFSN